MAATGNTRQRTLQKLSDPIRLSKKEHVLLMHSESVKSISWLKPFLIANRRITAEVLASLAVAEQNMFASMIPDLVKQATAEWIGDLIPEDDLEDRRVACALCGTDNRYVFIIENKLNRKKLNVGSTCIKYFGIKIGERGMSVAEAIRMIDRNRKKAYLLQAVSDPSAIKEWDFTANYPIIIPKGLRNSFDRLGVEVQSFCEKFMAGKAGDEVISVLEAAIEKRKGLAVDFENYVEQNKNKSFIITRELYLWAKDNFPKEWRDWTSWIERRETAGTIDWGIAARLAQEKFARSLIAPLNDILAAIKAMILDFDRSNRIFRVKLDQTGVILDVPYFEMIQNFGGPIFGKALSNQSSIGLLLEKAKIFERHSLDIVISRLGEQLRGTGYHFNEEDKVSGELIAFRKDIGKYIKTHRQTFANKFLSVALNSDNAAESAAIIEYINALPGKQYTLGDLREAEDFERQMRKKDY